MMAQFQTYSSIGSLQQQETHLNDAGQWRGIDRPIIFFDGECVMCNWFVDLMMRLDPDATILLSPLQGETAKRILPPLPAASEEWTIYYLDESGLSERSEAVVRICRRLNNWISSFSLIAVIPLPLRDRAYNLIAKNRYNLFGRRDTCRLPTPQEQARFLD